MITITLKDHRHEQALSQPYGRAALAISDGAMAWSPVDPIADRAISRAVATSMVGGWLYNLQGRLVGNVHSLAGGSRTAVALIGSYIRSGGVTARRDELSQAIKPHFRSSMAPACT